ncbi:MFS transporter [Acidisoma sp. L85]|uniref:MFS transporter n=1 Tax=Acidisoma sp. L85 TaxID=1641850 RepID=UPI001C203414|nr:MFS transporter [Acidisoma sp. L85]
MSVPQGSSIPKHRAGAASAAGKGPWVGVWAIALGAFAIVLAEFLPVGLLPGISRGFDISEGKAALTISSTAVFAFLAAPITTVVIGQVNRKWALLSLSVLLIIANVLSSIASEFLILMVGRIILGLALGGFWAIAVTAAGNLVANDKVSSASSLVFAGISVAAVVAVPAGSYVSAHFDWRVAFIISSVLSTATAIFQLLYLPSITTCHGFKLVQFVCILRSKRIRGIFGTILFIVAGQYAGFTFVTPYLGRVSGIGNSDLNILLCGYGLMAVAGNFVGGALAKRSPQFAVLVTAISILLSVLVVAAFAAYATPVCVAVMVWALAWGMVPVCTQLWLFNFTRESAEVAQAINTSVFQLSIGLGSLVGSLAVTHIGLHASMWFGAGILALALTLVVSISHAERVRVG